jgi:hypothetical protein
LASGTASQQATFVLVFTSLLIFRCAKFFGGPVLQAKLASRPRTVRHVLQQQSARPPFHREVFAEPSAMLTSQVFGRLRRYLVPLAALAAIFMSGCATTTTTTVETTMHAPDTSFRFQSCDMTARVQIEFKRQ